MAPDHFAMKQPPRHIVDLENGDRIELDSSTPSSFENSIGKPTPVPHRNGEETNTRARDGWLDSPQWKTIEKKIPTHISRCARKVGRWLRGPQPAKKNQIKPLFEPVQTFHIRLFARLPKFVRLLLFVGAFVLWIVVFGEILSNHGLPHDIGGFGAPVKLSCTNKLW
jgi:hypothetical protein